MLTNCVGLQFSRGEMLVLCLMLAFLMQKLSVCCITAFSLEYAQCVFARDLVKNGGELVHE